jgi:hypothetical protein
MLSMNKPSSSDRQSVTDRAFREIVDSERARRAASMARLRAERLGQPLPEPAKPKHKAKRA